MTRDSRRAAAFLVALLLVLASLGTALGIHPLAVLIVTIAGGALFGTVGLVLAGPLTSAIVRISEDLSRAEEEKASDDQDDEDHADDDVDEPAV